jgi:hypothetical protein
MKQEEHKRTVPQIRVNLNRKKNLACDMSVKNNTNILYTKVKKFMIIARASRLEPEACRGFYIRDFFTVVYILFFSLLDSLKPFLIIIINQIILSDATIQVLIFQRLL